MNGLEFLAGAVITLLAGMLNGSWNICVSPSAPSFLRSVGPSKASAAEASAADAGPVVKAEPDWTYDHSWLSYSLHSMWFNVLLSFLLVPPGPLFSTVSSSPASDVVLIVLFSALWGLGTYGFGVAVQVAGLGLGTTLTMSVIVVVGTLLPLLLDVSGKVRLHNEAERPLSWGRVEERSDGVS